MLSPTVALALSTGFALVSVVLSVVSLVLARRLTRWQSWPLEQVTQLQADCDEHAVQLSQHHERIRKINARLAARDRRQNAKPADASQDDLPLDAGNMATGRLPGEDDLAWKRRMRLLIAQGKLGHG